MKVTTQPSGQGGQEIVINLPEFIGAETAVIALTALGIVCRKFLTRKYHAVVDSLSYSIDWHENIAGILHSIKSKLSANRVLLFKAHNGEYHTDKSHYWKLSCRHEVVGLGLATIQDSFQNIPAYYFQSLLESNTLLISPTASLKDSHLANLLTSKGISQIASYTFLDSKEEVIALLIIDDNENGHESIETELKQIEALLKVFHAPTWVDHLKSLAK